MENALQLKAQRIHSAGPPGRPGADRGSIMKRISISKDNLDFRAFIIQVGSRLALNERGGTSSCAVANAVRAQPGARARFTCCRWWTVAPGQAFPIPQEVGTASSRGGVSL